MYQSLGKPHVARFTEDNHIVKDHYYYAGNDVAWNRPARIGPKFYPYFHAQNDANNDRIEDFKVQYLKDKNKEANAYREKIVKIRDDILNRHTKKVRERIIIQQKSCQAPLHAENIPNDESTNKELCDIIANKVNSMKYARSKELSWNFMERAPPKQIKQFLSPMMVKGEVEMLHVIKKRLDKEDNEQLEIEKKKEEFRRRLRKNTVERHERAFEFEKKLDTFSIRSTKNLSRIGNSATPTDLVSNIGLHKERSSISIDPSLTSLHKEFRLKFPIKLSKIDSAVLPSFGSDITKLKSPVGVNDLQRVLDVAQSELKGTLVKNMDRGVYNSTNPFHKALVETSDVFKDILDENLREKSPQNGSKILASMKLDDMNFKSNDCSRDLNISLERKLPPLDHINHIRSPSTVPPERRSVLDDITTFEKSFKAMKPRGRGKAQLEEADRILLEIGVPGLRNFKEANKESPKQE